MASYYGRQDPPSRPYMIRYGVLMGLMLLPGMLLAIGLTNSLFIAVVRIDPQAGKDLAHGVDELRFGVWSYCQNRIDLSLGQCPSYAQCKRGYDNATPMLYECTPRRSGYEVTIQPINESNNRVTIPRSKSQGLAVHPAALLVSLLAIFFRKGSSKFFASGAAFVLYFVSFIIDLQLYLYVASQMRKLENVGVVHRTTSGPGVWLTLVVTIFVFYEFAQCAIEVWIRRRRQSRGNQVGLPSAGVDMSVLRTVPQVSRPGFQATGGTSVSTLTAQNLARHSAYSSEASRRTASTIPVAPVPNIPKEEVAPTPIREEEDIEQFGVQMIPPDSQLARDQVQVQNMSGGGRGRGLGGLLRGNRSG